MKKIKITEQAALIPFLDIILNGIGIFCFIIFCLLPFVNKNNNKSNKFNKPTQIKPILIECRNDYIHIVQKKKKYYYSDNKIRRYFANIVQQNKKRLQHNEPLQYMIILIRPSGIDAYSHIELLIDKLPLPYVSQPLPENKKLNYNDVIKDYE